MSIEGLISVPSAHGPGESVARLTDEIRSRRLTLFAHIDHSDGAAALGLHLRPTDVLIFGHAKGGTPLMQAAQTLGIDLPLRALVWQDGDGRTWISYVDPEWLAARHGLAPSTAAALASALASIVASAAGGAP